MKRLVLRHERNLLRESALQGREGVELMTVVEWSVSEAKDLDLLVKSSVSGERSCGMIDRQT